MTDRTESDLFDESRELTPAEREALTDLIELANTYLIDRKGSRQAAIDALSIANGVINADNPGEEPGDHRFGITPGNVPEETLPPSYDPNAEAIDR